MPDDLDPDTALAASTALVAPPARGDALVPLTESPRPAPRASALRDAARLALDALDEAGDAIAGAIGLR